MGMEQSGRRRIRETPKRSRIDAFDRELNMVGFEMKDGCRRELMTNNHR